MQSSKLMYAMYECSESSVKNNQLKLFKHLYNINNNIFYFYLTWLFIDSIYKF